MRKMVEKMAACGIRQDDIARVIGIAAKTLRFHFRDELDNGSTKATALVAESLFRMATKGGNVAAAIFWMKARAGWREKIIVEAPETPLRSAPDADLAASVDARRARLAAIVGTRGSDSGEGRADTGDDGGVAEEGKG
jgi:hypothetical protein